MEKLADEFGAIDSRSQQVFSGGLWRLMDGDL